MKVLPLARKASLVVKEVDDETLIYDLETDEAHCLNQTAAQVWKHCDGRTSVQEIAQRLGKSANTPVDDKVVWLALEQLEKFKLLDTKVHSALLDGGISRRHAVRVLGSIAIALPLITTIVAPTAHAAGSLISLGECCNNPNECGSGCCEEDSTDPCVGPPPNKVCKPLGFEAGNPVCKPT
ncbi:MAG TPA: PqqD family protein [Pyrinomonadaceae bacterium]|nr:PqqD family protein [Pyrinomonadaceae bacterium]